MWECGLKQFAGGEADRPVGVTPYVGVWIETLFLCTIRRKKSVTPYVGVWIETISLLTVYSVILVTPYVGVWIETNTSRLEG